MATKKQRRAAALAKHNERMEEVRLAGLEAQRKDHENRRRKELADWQDNHDKRHGTKKQLIKECPHCQTILKAQRDAAKKADETEIDQAVVTDGEVDLSKPQTGPFPDEDYGPTVDMELVATS